MHHSRDSCGVLPAFLQPEQAGLPSLGGEDHRVPAAVNQERNALTLEEPLERAHAGGIDCREICMLPLEQPLLLPCHPAYGRRVSWGRRLACSWGSRDISSALVNCPPEGESEQDRPTQNSEQRRQQDPP